MKASTLPALFIITSLSVASAFAQIASDDASNYASWTDASNQGSGFLNWSLNNNNGVNGAAAGNFLGDSTSGAGDINTVGQSFGLFANADGGAFSTAIRSFSSALTTGDIFSFEMALNFDNGNKGFNLRSAGDSVFNFNVGSGGNVSSANATLNPGAGSGYDYGGNDAVLSLSFNMNSSNSFLYEVSRTSSLGSQGTLFSGEVTGVTGSIDNFEFYNAGTDVGDQNNLYFNNLNVIPEPGMAMLFLCGFGLIAFLRRRK